MAEANQTATGPSGNPSRERDLSAPELERLAELVYRLLRENIIRLRERRGEIAAPWR